MNKLISTKKYNFIDKIKSCSHDCKLLFSITKTLLGNKKNSTL